MDTKTKLELGAAARRWLRWQRVDPEAWKAWRRWWEVPDKHLWTLWLARLAVVAHKEDGDRRTRLLTRLAVVAYRDWLAQRGTVAQEADLDEENTTKGIAEWEEWEEWTREVTEVYKAFRRIRKRPIRQRIYKTHARLLERYAPRHPEWKGNLWRLLIKLANDPDATRSRQPATLLAAQRGLKLPATTRAGERVEIPLVERTAYPGIWVENRERLANRVQNFRERILVAEITGDDGWRLQSSEWWEWNVLTDSERTLSDAEEEPPDLWEMQWEENEEGSGWWMGSVPASDHGVLAEEGRQQFWHTLEEAVETLQERSLQQARVFVLDWFFVADEGELKQAEMAALLNLSHTNYRKTLERARRGLRSELAHHR